MRIFPVSRVLSAPIFGAVVIICLARPFRDGACGQPDETFAHLCESERTAPFLVLFGLSSRRDYRVSPPLQILPEAGLVSVALPFPGNGSLLSKRFRPPELWRRRVLPATLSCEARTFLSCPKAGAITRENSQRTTFTSSVSFPNLSTGFRKNWPKRYRDVPSRFFEKDF